MRASAGSFFRCSLASAVERRIASRRSRGLAMFVPSSATIIPIAVPGGLVVRVAQVDRDAGAQGPVGQLSVLAQVPAQRGAAEVQHDVVQRAVGGPCERLDAVELVLLGGEATLTGELAGERRARGAR